MNGKIKQTAGRDQLGDFAPMFAHLNDDVLFGEVWNEEALDLKTKCIIDSFLDAYDWTGKTVVPFFTSGRSDLGEGQDRIETLAKDAKVLRGKRFSAKASEAELKKWIDTM